MGVTTRKSAAMKMSKVVHTEQEEPSAGTSALSLAERRRDLQEIEELQLEKEVAELEERRNHLRRECEGRFEAIQRTEPDRPAV